MLADQSLEGPLVAACVRWIDRRPPSAATASRHRRRYTLPCRPVAFEVPRPRPLDHAGRVDLALALHQRADRMIVGAIGRLLEVAEFTAGCQVAAEEVLGQRVENVDAMDAISLADGNVEHDQA